MQQNVALILMGTQLGLLMPQRACIWAELSHVQTASDKEGVGHNRRQQSPKHCDSTPSERIPQYCRVSIVQDS